MEKREAFCIVGGDINCCSHYGKKYNGSPKKQKQDFLVGTVDKNPPANAGDTSSIPDLEKSHRPRNN